MYYNTVNLNVRFEACYRDKTKHNLIENYMFPDDSFPYNVIGPFRKTEKNVLKHTVSSIFQYRYNKQN